MMYFHRACVQNLIAGSIQLEHSCDVIYVNILLLSTRLVICAKTKFSRCNAVETMSSRDSFREVNTVEALLL